MAQEPVAGGRSVKIVLCNRWEEIEQLQPRWNKLLRESCADTFFLSWEWCASWWKAYAAKLRPYLLAGWEDGRLVGVAPLCIEQVRKMGRSWKLLKLIGDGSQDSDYLDCFAERGFEPAFAAAVLDYLDLHRNDWDYLELHGPLGSSPFVHALSSEVMQRGWASSCEDVPCLTLRLPHSWDEYLQMLKPRFRSKLRSCMGFFEQQLKARPTECTSEEQLKQWLPLFFDLHGRRWQSKGRTGVFLGDEKREFYLEMSFQALKAGALQFHRLDWGERPLAFQYGFLYDNRFLLLQEAYDPDFENLRPGVALRGLRLREMITRGVEEYDFLGGIAQHKIDWGAELKPAIKLTTTWSAKAALALLKVPATKAQVKEKLRSIAPEPLLAMRKKVLARQSASESSAIATRFSPKSMAAKVYVSTPLRRIGAWAADHYQRGRHLFPIEARKEPSCQILLFHRVNDDNDPFLPSTSIADFRRQMEYVANHCSVVTLDDVAEGRLGRSSKHSVAVTFDDGYRDNFTSAFPIMKELNLPATIFLATGYIGTGQIPWYDQVCLAFKLSTRASLESSEFGWPHGPIATREQRVAMLERTLAWLRELEDESRREALPALFKALGVPQSLTLPNYMLNWDEVRQMKAQNISFGAHTVTHPVLSRVTNAQLQEEIQNSKKTIEQKLQGDVRHFAYPFGRPADYNEAARSCLREQGFKTAVTTEFGFNSPGDDLLSLKRFTPWASDPAGFALQMDWYRFAGVGATTTKVAEIQAMPAAAGQGN